jgi:hypothetical protein
MPSFCSGANVIYTYSTKMALYTTICFIIINKKRIESSMRVALLVHEGIGSEVWFPTVDTLAHDA